MHKYREILILHPIDNSTKFLEPFKDSFGVNYYGFNSDTIYDVKAKLGDLEPKSLIVFIGIFMKSIFWMRCGQIIILKIMMLYCYVVDQMNL